MSRRTFIQSAGVAAVDAWRGVGRAGFLAPASGGGIVAAMNIILIALLALGVCLVGCGKKKQGELTNTSPDVAEVTDLHLENALVKQFFHVPNGKIRFTDPVRRTLELDLHGSSIKSVNGLQKFRGAESHRQSANRCEGSGESHAVNVAGSQQQPRPHQGSD